MNEAALQTKPSRPWWRRHVAATVALGVLAALVGAVALGEWLGWPFLAVPLQHWLSEKLERSVRFSSESNNETNNESNGNADTNASRAHGFTIRFLGGLRLHARELEIAAPTWSSAPYLVLARDVTLELRYADLWRAYQERGGGQPLRIQRLQASMLDGNLERQADGRASWQFGLEPPPLSAQPMPIPLFGHLQVAAGTLIYRDEPLAINVESHFSLNVGAPVLVATAAAPASTGSATATGQPAAILQANATGQYRKLPVKIELLASGALPWVTDEEAGTPIPLSLNATIGRANLVFKGSALDALHLSGLSGRFSLKGPSLAAVGDPLGVTLPTTSSFRTDGDVTKKGDTWDVVIADATVGASRLNGVFRYEPGRSVPLLSGKLRGTRLLLVDLGPVVGTTPAVDAAIPNLTSGSTRTAAQDHGKIKVKNKDKNLGRNSAKVLPDRPFDLPALRAMDADVLIDISEVDLNTHLLEPLRPLQAHLNLVGGVLTLSKLDARTGDGRLRGDLRLDGRGAKALWNADVRWDGVRLERWLRLARAEGAPPYVSGRLNGSANLQGQGRSTAEILATLHGKARTELRDGAVSHLAIEVAGLDVAESLGVLFTGDNALPVQCAVADLIAEGGSFRPRVMVLDTTDSAMWIDGSLSLATETLDLRAVVVPKDFSPLTLRTPLRVRGSFSHPEVSLEKGRMGVKLGSAFLLALVNPLAALIPLLDPGNAEDARRGAAGCYGLAQRSKAKSTPAK